MARTKAPEAPIKTASRPLSVVAMILNEDPSVVEVPVAEIGYDPAFADGVLYSPGALFSLYRSMISGFDLTSDMSPVLIRSGGQLWIIRFCPRQLLG